MSIPNIIAVGVLVAAVLAIIGVRIYTMRKNNVTITFDDFISMYSEQIIKVLQDVIVLLQINVDEFEDKETYEKTIISTTIDMLKENSAEFGIDAKLVNLFDTDNLTEIVYTIFNGNLVKVFSVIDADKIVAKSELYESEVVAALSEA